MAAGRAEVLQEGFRKQIGDTSRMLGTFLKPEAMEGHVRQYHDHQDGVLELSLIHI